MKVNSVLRSIYRAYISPSKKKASYSQYAEDLLIKLLLDTPKKKGVYVDVGCHHPRRGSNTYLLYKSGWSGLLIDLEDEKVLACKLSRLRDTAILAAVSDKEQDVGIFSPKNFSTNTTIHADSIKEGYKKVSEITTQTLTALLKKHHIPLNFELLSIDVEGADYDVLKGLDLKKYQPSVICIENWGATQGIETILEGKIHQHLIDEGYALKAWSGLSTIYKKLHSTKGVSPANSPVA